ncbi:TMEM9 protein [Dictyocaulus viviparus]|uniref:TMEM9 protein n=1 Tax=Dictyocaulus viviparus TaxID=29172 RepID=A0A0D8Y6U6_DICVI|nr:TMEM9 protein [Dictyocaulus viviparus]
MQLEIIPLFVLMWNPRVFAEPDGDFEKNRVADLIVALIAANFEDTRCRCVCPSTLYFVAENLTDHGDNHRRYYTMTNISPSFCSPQSVVKGEVAKIVDEFHMDAFLANCDCRFESRNTVMLKVVVIFLICVIMVLVAYMAFLMCLDPVLRKQRFHSFYRQQNDEMEENIFARAVEGSSSEAVSISSMRGLSSNKGNVLGRVEAEQNRWIKKVEEQRRNIFEDHTMLN